MAELCKNRGNCGIFVEFLANDQMLSVKSDVCGTFLDLFQGCLHGRLDVLQTLLVAPPSWIQDGGAGNDVNQDLGYFFRSLLRGRCKMATLPLPAAILDDLICGTGNEVIQDGGRKCSHNGLMVLLSIHPEKAYHGPARNATPTA